jgi:hypothetical protein
MVGRKARSREEGDEEGTSSVFWWRDDRSFGSVPFTSSICADRLETSRLVLLGRR